MVEPTTSSAPLSSDTSADPADVDAPVEPQLPLSAEESRRSFLERIGGSLAPYMPGYAKREAEKAARAEREAAAAAANAPPIENAPASDVNATAAQTAEIEALKAQIAALSATAVPVAAPEPDPPPDLTAWQLKVVADFGESVADDRRDYLAQLYDRRAAFLSTRDAQTDDEQKARYTAQLDAIEREIGRERRDHDHDQAIAALKAEIAELKTEKPAPYDPASDVEKIVAYTVENLTDKLPRVAHALTDPGRKEAILGRINALNASDPAALDRDVSTLFEHLEAVLPEPPPPTPQRKDPLDFTRTQPIGAREALSLDGRPEKPLSNAESRRAFFERMNAVA